MNVKEKYTALELMGLVQHIEEQKTKLRWCNSDQQLADGLTKASAQDRLKQFLLKGQRWNLRYDEEFVSAKKTRKRIREEEDAADDVSWIEFLQGLAAPAKESGVCEYRR